MGSNRMRAFDPKKVAFYEKENWVAYYNKDWLRLMTVSVRMVKEAFGLSLLQSLYGAYLVARAEVAAAPYPVNDIERAEEYMRRFYSFVSQVHGEGIDATAVAKLEVRWWVVHRAFFGSRDHREVADALTDLYAALYRVPAERVQAAAAHRAQAMVYSDQWVNEGRKASSSLLKVEEAELVMSYTALRDALTTSSL